MLTMLLSELWSAVEKLDIKVRQQETRGLIAHVYRTEEKNEPET